MSSKCGVCAASVYPMDPQINLDGCIFHKTCAKCEECKCQITLSNFTKTGNTLLCKTHYFKKFHEEGTYVGGEKYTQKTGRSYSPPPPVGAPTTAPVGHNPTPVVASITNTCSASAASDIPQTSGSVKDRMKMFGSNVGNQTKCADCNRSVYANDPQIVLDGVVYHKECAKCSDCRCQITIQNFTKSGTTLYCKTHYFKKFNEEGTYLGGDKYSHKSAPGTYVVKKANFTSNDDATAPSSHTSSAAPANATASEQESNTEVAPENVQVEVVSAPEEASDDAPEPCADDIPDTSSLRVDDANSEQQPADDFVGGAGDIAVSNKDESEAATSTEESTTEGV